MPIPLIPATHSEGSRPAVPVENGQPLCNSKYINFNKKFSKLIKTLDKFMGGMVISPKMKTPEIGTKIRIGRKKSEL